MKLFKILIISFLSLLFFKTHSAYATDKDMTVTWDHSGISIKSKYTDNIDIERTVKQLSANKTFQLGDINLIENNYKTTLYYQCTDMISPWHNLKALQNIDGDDPKAQGFTGGWHAYDNRNSGTPTARTTSILCFPDNYRIEQGSSVKCEKVTIVIHNNIQAINTKKKDGRGREVLQEDVVLEFDSEKLDVTVFGTPLENVTLESYYFLQFQCGSKFRKRFKPVNNYVSLDWLYDYSKNIRGEYVSPELAVNKLVFEGPEDVAEMSFENELGLGFLNNNKRLFSWHYNNYSKAYFDVIQSSRDQPALFEKGDFFFCVGKYRFYRK